MPVRRSHSLLFLSPLYKYHVALSHSIRPSLIGGTFILTMLLIYCRLHYFYFYPAAVTQY